MYIGKGQRKPSKENTGEMEKMANNANNNQNNNANIEILAVPGDGDYGLAGAEYEFQMDAEPVECTFSATGLPEFLEVTPEGLIHGDIPEDWANECISFDVQVTDPNGNTLTERIDLYVVEDNY